MRTRNTKALRLTLDVTVKPGSKPEEIAGIMTRLLQKAWTTPDIAQGMAKVIGVYSVGEFALADVLEPAATPKAPPKPIVCSYDLAYCGPCGKPPTAQIDPPRCSDHVKETCVSCGKPATRQCDMAVSLVCGYPLCDGCEHGESSGRSAGTIFSGMDGGHRPRKQVEQA